MVFPQRERRAHFGQVLVSVVNALHVRLGGSVVQEGFFDMGKPLLSVSRNDMKLASIAILQRSLERQVD